MSHSFRHKDINNVNASADYEIGRVLARSGDTDSARKHFELVLSGKPISVVCECTVISRYLGKSLEVNASTRKVCAYTCLSVLGWLIGIPGKVQHGGMIVPG